MANTQVSVGECILSVQHSAWVVSHNNIVLISFNFIEIVILFITLSSLFFGLLHPHLVQWQSPRWETVQFRLSVPSVIRQYSPRWTTPLVCSLTFSVEDSSSVGKEWSAICIIIIFMGAKSLQPCWWPSEALKPQNVCVAEKKRQNLQFLEHYHEVEHAGYTGCARGT